MGLGQVTPKPAVPTSLPAGLPSFHLSQAFPLVLPPHACQNWRWRPLHLVTSSSLRRWELPSISAGETLPCPLSEIDPVGGSGPG